VQSLGSIDFLCKSIPRITDRELVGLARFIAVPKDKLPNEMVKGRAEIMNNITCDNREPYVGLRERISDYYVPTTLMPYMEITAIGVLFAPDTKLRFESAMVLLGPPEFGSNASEVSNTNGHMLYSDHEREENAKDAQGSRDTHTKPRGLSKEPRPSGENPQETITASTLSEPKLETERDHPRGDYTVNHTRLDSLEDA
jgi:hypothetical protein